MTGGLEERCARALSEYEASDARPMTLGEKEAFRVGFAVGESGRASAFQRTVADSYTFQVGSRERDRVQVDIISRTTGVHEQRLDLPASIATGLGVKLIELAYLSGTLVKP